jgi:hypothetical protein
MSDDTKLQLLAWMAKLLRVEFEIATVFEEVAREATEEELAYVKAHLAQRQFDALNPAKAARH